MLRVILCLLVAASASASSSASSSAATAASTHAPGCCCRGQQLKDEMDSMAAKNYCHFFGGSKSEADCAGKCKGVNPDEERPMRATARGDCVGFGDDEKGICTEVVHATNSGTHGQSEHPKSMVLPTKTVLIWETQHVAPSSDAGVRPRAFGKARSVYAGQSLLEAGAGGGAGGGGGAGAGAEEGEGQRLRRGRGGERKLPGKAAGTRAKPTSEAAVSLGPGVPSAAEDGTLITEDVAGGR